MGYLRLSAKDWLRHLVPLMDVKDVVINYADGKLAYDIAHSTYYFQVDEEIPIVHGIYDFMSGRGSLTFSDIPKAVAFLKKCKNAQVTIKNSQGNRLMLQCGNKKMSIPCYDSVTAQRVSSFKNLVSGMTQSGHQTFGNASLSQNGTIVMNDILDIASLGKLVANDSDFEVKMNQTEEEFALKAFKTNSTSMFVSTSIDNGEGIEGTVTSSFGPWILPCLKLLAKDVPSNVYMGNATVLVIEQEDRLLIVIDQE